MNGNGKDIREDGVSFELWRQDDNGNHFLIGAFPDRGGAEQRLEELARNLHKQTYWIRENHGEPLERD